MGIRLSGRRPASQLTDPRRDDLVFLRKGPGATAARLTTRPGLLQLLGVREATAGIERLRSLIADRAADRRFAALQVAYGFAGDCKPTLEKRREHLAAQYGRSLDAVRDWEDKAISELLIQLQTAPPMPEEPPSAFLIEQMTAAYLIINRHFRRSRHRRDVLVKASEVTSFRYSLTEETRLQNVWGATVTVDDRTPGGTIYRFHFPQVLARGQHHSFGWDEVRPDGTPTPPMEEIQDYASQVFHQPTTRYDLTVTFKGELPTQLWCFERLALAERPGRPAATNSLKPDRTGEVAAHYADQHGGFYSGIAWRWQ